MVLSAWYIVLAFLLLLSSIYSMLVVHPFNQTQASLKWKRSYIEPITSDITIGVTKTLIFTMKLYVKLRKAKIEPNIRYMGNYAIISLQDRMLKGELFVPYRKGLKVTTRYKACAYKDGVCIHDLSSLPGLPILVKASELDADEIAYVSPARGRIIRRYSAGERPVTVLLDRKAM